MSFYLSLFSITFFLRKLSAKVFIFLSLLYAVSAQLYMECNYQFLHIQNLKDFFTCDAKLKSSRFSRQIERVSTDYLQSEVDLAAVQYLQILFQPIDFIPRRVEHFFPNLVGLRISNGKIKQLTKRDLQPFYKLELLSLDGNKIEVLDSDLFDYTPNLKWIYFDYNNIAQVGQGIFDSLVYLKQVNLELNPCISRDVWGRTEIAKLKSELPRKCPLIRRRFTSRNSRNWNRNNRGWIKFYKNFSHKMKNWSCSVWKNINVKIVISFWSFSWNFLHKVFL